MPAVYVHVNVGVDVAIKSEYKLGVLQGTTESPIAVVVLTVHTCRWAIHRSATPRTTGRVATIVSTTT